MDRYFLSSDESGQKYAVPVSRRREWNAFLDIDPDDPSSWDVPEWAIRIDGSFTFADPRND